MSSVWKSDDEYDHVKARKAKYHFWMIKAKRLRVTATGELEHTKSGELVHYAALAEANNRIVTLAESQEQLLRRVRDLEQVIETRDYIEMDIVKEGRLVMLPNTDIVLKLIAHEREAHGESSSNDVQSQHGQAA